MTGGLVERAGVKGTDDVRIRYEGLRTFTRNVRVRIRFRVRVRIRVRIRETFAKTCTCTDTGKGTDNGSAAVIRTFYPRSFY